MKSATLKMVRMKLTSLKPATYNPRTIDPVSKAGLAASIHEFGLVEPIIYNKRTGNIVGGHQRYNQLVEDDVTHTDVVEVDLDETKEKLLNVTLNNKHIAGTYDETKLQDLLDESKNEHEDLFKRLNMEPLTLPDESEFKTSFNLSDNPRGDLVRMKFMVTHDQKEYIDNAIRKAISLGPFFQTGNENKNGNALARICEGYV